MESITMSTLKPIRHNPKKTPNTRYLMELRQMISCSLADYFHTKEGVFDHIRFWMDHNDEFPVLWPHAIEGASCKPTEVSCESLFSISGYKSGARQTTLKAMQFEREVIMSYNIQHVFFDIKHAVNVFLKRTENKDWDGKESRDMLYYMEQEEELFLLRGHNDEEWVEEDTENDIEIDEDEFDEDIDDSEEV
jgi:hypothetical protein